MGAGAFLVQACRHLAAHLLACEAPNDPASTPPPEAVRRRALRRVAERCLYGVDLDPVAVCLARLSIWLEIGDPDLPPTFLAPALREGDALVGSDTAVPTGRDPADPPPFLSWETAFPEVFSRSPPGFDAVVGNPPFLGGKRIQRNLGPACRARLSARYPDIPGNADLCAWFFRRAGDLLREGGRIGFVATRNIAGGATREAALGALLAAGFRIYHARSPLPWPGAGTAVPVAVVHLVRGPADGQSVLNGRKIPHIDSHLRPRAEGPEPSPLRENACYAWGGCVVDGPGFILAPSRAAELVAADPTLGQVLRPYLSGDEVNCAVDAGPRRYVIDFRDLPLEEARRWPVLLDHVERLVRPRRLGHPEEAARTRWWQFRRPRMDLRRALAPLPRCLVCSMACRRLVFAFRPTGQVFSHKLCVIASADAALFGVLQGRAHDAWARLHGSVRGRALNYTPSRCFDPFPFPSASALGPVARLAEAFHTLRDEVARDMGKGLTHVHARLDDGTDAHPGVVALRRIRDDLDRAVLDAWGWNDVAIEDDDEVLDRLHALHAARLQAETASEPGR